MYFGNCLKSNFHCFLLAVIADCACLLAVTGALRASCIRMPRVQMSLRSIMWSAAIMSRQFSFLSRHREMSDVSHQQHIYLLCMIGISTAAGEI